MRSLITVLTGWKGYAAVGLLVAVSVWTVQEWRHDAKHARLVAGHSRLLEEQAIAVVESVQAARQIERQRAAAVEKERDHAIEKNVALAADVAASRTVSERMRTELNSLRASHASGNTSAAAGGPSQSGADAIGLLIDMYTGLDQAGRDVAEYADRLRIAGLACERAYDAVRTDTEL